MADYTNSRYAMGAAWPDHAVETPWQQVEPLITPQQLRSRHLLGLPLISGTKGMDGRCYQYTNENLADFIDGAVSQAEVELGIDIAPVQRQEKLPFDLNQFQHFGYFQLSHRPVSSIDHLSVNPTSGADLYVIPPEWIETAYLQRGQICLLPFMIATTGGVQGTGYGPGNIGGSAFLVACSSWSYIPAWWKISYTSGFKDMMLPRAVNEYIGTLAAMETLSNLASTFARTTSSSIGVDGLSQSQSGPGGQLYLNRLKDLEVKLSKIGNKLKGFFGFKISVGVL
jgi:hypothetical protein